MAMSIGLSQAWVSHLESAKERQASNYWPCHACHTALGATLLALSKILTLTRALAVWQESLLH
jgi:hypothetical protein